MSTHLTPEQEADKRGAGPAELSGRVAWVTGGGRGIGRAIALELARRGAAVAIAARTQEQLEAVGRELEALGGEHFEQVCDVRDSGSLEAFSGALVERLGAVDILVNNAGVYRTAPVRGHSIDIWREVIETNLTGALLAVRLVLDGMIERGWGRIINISSVSGKTGEAFGAAYSASKFGLIGLTQSLSLEVARHGITVNAVCPGWVETSMAAGQLSDRFWCSLNSLDPEHSPSLARLSVPQERFIEPDEVAALATYLCSHAARGITGQAINVCGGLGLH